MSYILDALRKADAERARGSVPRLHTQTLAGADAAEVAPRRPPWRWVALAGLAVLLGALGWWAGRQSAPVPATVPVAKAPAEAQGPAAQAAVPALAASPPAAAAPAPAPLPTPAAPAPVAAAPTPALITLPDAALEPAREPSSVPASPQPARATRDATAAAVVASAPPPAASRVPLMTELPADLRRQLPALTMGGSVYSDRPASRFVMINGQLLREGDTVAPGLVLEGLRPKSAVLVFRGQRFELPY
jgi:general secretion pathway protein B